MPSSRKWILLLNILIIAVIYVIAANTANSSDGVMFGFFVSIIHTAANLALAIICMLIYLVQRIREASTELALSLCITFFISTVLVVILSFPTCLVIGKI